MRVDTGVDPWAPFCHVHLDGQLLTHCFVADEEGGYAEVTEFDPASLKPRQPIPDATCPRGFRTRMVWGKVELRFRDAELAGADGQRAAEERSRS